MIHDVSRAPVNMTQPHAQNTQQSWHRRIRFIFDWISYLIIDWIQTANRKRSTPDRVPVLHTVTGDRWSIAGPLLGNNLGAIWSELIITGIQSKINYFWLNPVYFWLNLWEKTPEPMYGPAIGRGRPWSRRRRPGGVPGASEPRQEQHRPVSRNSVKNRCRFYFWLKSQKLIFNMKKCPVRFVRLPLGVQEPDRWANLMNRFF